MVVATHTAFDVQKQVSVKTVSIFTAIEYLLPQFGWKSKLLIYWHHKHNIDLYWFIYEHLYYASHPLPHIHTLSHTHIQIISHAHTHFQSHTNYLTCCHSLQGGRLATFIQRKHNPLHRCPPLPLRPESTDTGQRRPADKQRHATPSTTSRTRSGPTHHKRKRRRRKRQQRSNSSTSRQSFDYIFNWTAAGLDVCGCVHGPRRITELRLPRVAPLRRRRHRHLPTSVISQPWSGGPPLKFFFLRKMPIGVSDSMQFTTFFTSFSIFTA